MSTIKVTNIEHASTANGGIQLDSSGHVTVDGQQLPTSGQLSNRNLFFNGACEINQRGTVSNSDTYGGPDRFIAFLNVTGYACERSQQIDAPANTGLQKCYQLKTTTARTGTTADQYVGIGQFLEFQDAHNAIWGGHSHVTMSFWVKSSITGTFAFNMNPCNTDSGFSGNRVLYHATYTISSADTWEKKTITIPLAGLTDNHGILSTAESAQIARGVEFTWMLGISSGGNRTSASTGWSTSEGRNAVSSFSSDTGFMSTVDATFKLTGIQFEVGEKVTPFEHRSHYDELARCQRYYYKHVEGASLSYANGTYYNSTLIACHIHFPTTMRAAPTIEVESGTDYYRAWRNGTADDFNNMVIARPTTTGTAVDASNTGASGTAGHGAVLATNNASSFIAFTAEL